MGGMGVGKGVDVTPHHRFLILINDLLWGVPVLDYLFYLVVIRQRATCAWDGNGNGPEESREETPRTD